MKRTIAAILAADVAGYSRLIAEDEEDTLRRLAAAKGVFRAQVAAFGGRVFNTAGDAILAEFPSAVEALRAGLAIQCGLNDLDRGDPSERRVRFRMGLTIGD
ncbi:adenylate/guanylate cyclase domain-containing protein, partial [Methylobacterium trifolii]|uniref:adenylate/guanylate cyclase domain-containing protein n=1 Tax=Methylobacterium trifolii TaxID=1003092 RepID=UPI001EDF3660